MLKILIWNVRGLNDRGKQATVKEFIVINKVSIVCLQETKMEVMTQGDIRAISGGKFEGYIFKPSLGASGGILIGWNDRLWKMVDQSIDEFSITVVLEDRVTQWQWMCTSVYGPNIDEDRGRVWEELHSVGERRRLPWCIVGDFNVTRFMEDRNRLGVINAAMYAFSEWIDVEGLIDLPIDNLTFTWSNMREAASMARLDRALVSTEWEDSFSGCTLTGLPRVCSDHSPLLLSGGALERHRSTFRFENWWLISEGFRDLVESSWNSGSLDLRGAKKVAFKLKRLKLGLKQWHRAEIQRRRRRKSELAEEIDKLDRWEEAGLLDDEDRAVRISLKGEWALLENREDGGLCG
ncbi:hypothetical protein QJS10_CPA07g00623 [Acorus calamus]|uniref:Endonuclease/exonuclease/phosphatase domain-containing protein n=1 Tax=Acorus calamus TaxID=4465 RepID=A0AAV9EFH6_ACOCL|nr:hypothetical protein QJS10_CPA07g00623 [Acorus calamus]